MAKTNSAKFAKVISELKKSNIELSESSGTLKSDITELKKSVSDLENISLLILEKLRRMEQYPIVKTKSGKLIAPKVAGTDRHSLSPANDEFGEQEADMPLGKYYKHMLLKMYNFMVRNAEDEKKQRNYEKSKTKERKKERKVNYQKELKKAGLDPKFFRKRKGILGKIGTGLKWGFFGAIGAGLSGLIWLFSDEIKKFSSSLTKSIEDLGTKLTDNFEKITTFLSGIYNRFLKPLGSWISTSIIDPIMNLFGTSTEGLSKFLGDNMDSMWTRITFFSVSQSKLPGYIIPIFPALALLIGNRLYRDWETDRKSVV